MVERCYQITIFITVTQPSTPQHHYSYHFHYHRPPPPPPPLPTIIITTISSPLNISLSFQFKKMFEWIEPKICVNNVKGSTSLPESGKKEDCAPCNPGMFMNGTTCDFCPPMTYGDGKGTSE